MLRSRHSAAVLAVLTCLLVGAGASPARACRFQPAPFDAQLERATVVFVGTVAALAGDGQPPSAKFDVEAVLKGSPARRQLVTTHPSSCGLRFSTGEKWLILAGGSPLGSSLPSGSLLLVDSRGLAERENMEMVRTLFGPKALPAPNACLAAQLRLYDGLAVLPTTCSSAADCETGYVDPQPCAWPVPLRRGWSTPATEARLVPLQRAARAACASEWSRAPACSPPVVAVTCASGRCAIDTEAPVGTAGR